MKGQLPFALLAGQLKLTPRTGWVHSLVPGRIESVAEHSWRVALLALTLPAPDGVDRNRAVRMGLLHDIQEATVGDIMPEKQSGIAPKDKHERELAAVENIAAMLPEESGLNSELMELFNEYEAGTSATARFVKDLDKAEMLLQALEYETQHTGLSLQDFFDSTVAKIEAPSVRQLVQDALEKRK